MIYFSSAGKNEKKVFAEDETEPNIKTCSVWYESVIDLTIEEVL